MKRNRPGHTVNGEVAKDIATLRAGLFYAPALECDLRKSLDIEKFRAAQVIVSLFDPGVDALNIDLRRHRRILRALTIKVDLTVELRELSVRGSQKLLHTKTNRRTR